MRYKFEKGNKFGAKDRTKNLGIHAQKGNIPWNKGLTKDDPSFSIDNCRTVCASCHYRITFGKPMPKDLRGWGHNLLKEEGRGLI